MSRLFSNSVAKGGAKRACAGLVLFALTAAAGLGLIVDPSLAKDKARGPKRRAAEAEADAAKDSQPGEPVAESTEIAEKSSDAQAAAGLTLLQAIEFIKESRAPLKDVKDYTAHFSKSERIGGHLLQQEMEMKFRAKPFSVYLFYQSDKERGRQAIFVDGRSNNNLLVKEAKGLAGVVGAVPLRLEDPRVKKENLYPVTHVGIANMLEETIKEWEHDLKVAGDDVDVQFYPNAKVKGVPCQAIQVTHLKKLKDIKYSKNRIYFDKETKLPIRGERFGWPRRAGEEPPLVEDYKYTNLKTNVNLPDAEFSPARYGF
jgi:hypothetical protein